jgi:hypothetical protein
MEIYYENKKTFLLWENKLKGVKNNLLYELGL